MRPTAPSAPTALLAARASPAPTAPLSPSLRTFQFKKDWWPRCRPHGALSLPGSPEIGECLHHVHRPQSPSRGAAGGEIGGPTKHLGAEAGGNRGLVLLREKTADDAAQDVAASAGG